MVKTPHDGSPIPATDRLLDEGILLVVDAAAAEGIRISSKTAIRWCLAGMRGVRLENVKARGRRMTSRAAIRRFIAATQDRPVPASAILDRAAANKVLGAFGL
jgi:hypothetical protein